MSVVFQLGYNDQKSVEDFLDRRPGGVGGIVLHHKAAPHQMQAAETAKAAGLPVHYNPATERLTGPGYSTSGMSYLPETPYDLNHLAEDASERARLIEGVLAAHPEHVTTTTPPHFYVSDDRSANLNVVLAADAQHSTDRPLHAVLVMAHRYGISHAESLAASYASAGVTDIELRLSPFGGEDESLKKIQSALTMLDLFRAAGISVTLGWSGNLGRAAVALGHADAYSIGIGVHEKVNFSEAMARQKRPPKYDEAGKKKGGQFEGVYLAGISQTLGRRRAQQLLDHSDLRLRLGCRLEGCGATISGPASDPKRHYLHARADEMASVLARPAAWRAATEIDRVTHALDLRKLLNERYRRDGEPALRIRTLQSLLDLADTASAARHA